MRKILIAAVVAAALVPMLPAGALAAERHGGAAAGGKVISDAVARQREASLLQERTSRVRFVPLGAVLTGMAELNGHVYGLARDYSDGSWQMWEYPASGATMTWAVSSPDGTGSGETTTDSGGAYTLTGVAPAAGNGLADAALRTDPEWGWRYELTYTDRTWADGGVTTYDFHPGMATMTMRGGGPWAAEIDHPWVTMRGTDAGGGVESYTILPPGGSFDPAFGLAGTYTRVCAYWYTNEGMEKPADLTVTAGAETASGLSFNETYAQRLWEVNNYSASGDPGTVVRLRLQNFPAGEVTDFYGYQYEPVVTPLASLGSYTARDLANQYRSVTVPSTATPGQDYVIGGQHRDGLLDLRVYFQVTRLKGPAAASGSYRLTGRVPIQGYDGSSTDTGRPKYVSLYRRFTAAGQPKGDPTKYGWRFVRRYQTSATGTFSTRYMNPGRNAWYVVFYPGDRDNWAGFTSVRRVRHS